jgi:hypothetical protein
MNMFLLLHRSLDLLLPSSLLISHKLTRKKVRADIPGIEILPITLQDPFIYLPIVPILPSLDTSSIHMWPQSEFGIARMPDS